MAPLIDLALQRHTIFESSGFKRQLMLSASKLNRYTGASMSLGKKLQRLGEIAPRPIAERWNRLLATALILREFRADMAGYLRTSSLLQKASRTPSQLERDATIAYHQVEKGLSLPNPRRPFGELARKEIVRLSKADNYELVSPSTKEAASNALAALSEWSRDGTINPLVAPSHTPPSIDPNLAKALFSSRRSCRNFNMDRKVPTELLEEAVILAQETPSVCNRQAARIKLFTDPNLIRSALELQNGNRGFTSQVPILALVSVDRNFFRGAGERNQRWIDGALFAMTFVWAAHGLGLSSCMLNWSMGLTATKALRSRALLAENQDIICMIAIGYASRDYHVARSHRRPLDDVLSWNNG